MHPKIIRGPARNVSYIIYRDGTDEVRVTVAAAMSKDGLPVYDVFLKDVTTTAKGQPVSPVLREKIRRELKIQNPFDGELLIS
jgi:hypothetical protein